MQRVLHLLAFAPLLLAACSRSESVQEQIMNPKVGDVYVVQFQPQGDSTTRYFFYHLYRATPDSVYLHPARKDSPSPDADLHQLSFEPSAVTIAYTHAQLRELLQEQPGDVTRSKLIKVRRS